jgi:hypothetical protein
MIPGEKEFKPIQIYMYICDLYDRELKYGVTNFAGTKS